MSRRTREERAQRAAEEVRLAARHGAQAFIREQERRASDDLARRARGEGSENVEEEAEILAAHRQAGEDEAQKREVARNHLVESLSRREQSDPDPLPEQSTMEKVLGVIDDIVGVAVIAVAAFEADDGVGDDVVANRIDERLRLSGAWEDVDYPLAFFGVKVGRFLYRRVARKGL